MFRALENPARCRTTVSRNAVCLGRTIAAILFAALTGCHGFPARVEVDESGRLDRFEAFEWNGDAASKLPELVEGDAAELARRIQAALQPALEELGLRLDPTAESKVIVAYELSVESRVRDLHPYFTQDVAEEIESGTMTLELRDGASDEVLFRGTATTDDLRTAARSRGLFTSELTPTHDPREWPIEDLVHALARRLRRGDR